MASPTLKIENARFLLTLDGDRRIVRDGSILIEGNRIARVGKAAELADAGADRVIDARGFVVTPGLFNGHMHISYAHAVRGIFPDDVQGRLTYVFRLQAVMTEEEEYWTTLLGVVELLKNGTTCFVDPGSTKYVGSDEDWTNAERSRSIACDGDTTTACYPCTAATVRNTRNARHSPSSPTTRRWPSTPKRSSSWPSRECVWRLWATPTTSTRKGSPRTSRAAAS